MNRFAIGCGVVLVIVLCVVVVAALAIGGSYNRLVRLQQAVDQSWAQVQNVYQRRADLIPNLVNTVSGAANFEKSTLTEVTNARTENRISVERGNFNTAVQDYNVAVRSFPTNLIAGMLGFPPKPFFTAQPGAEKPPPVQFNFGSPATSPAPAASASP